LKFGCVRCSSCSKTRVTVACRVTALLLNGNWYFRLCRYTNSCAHHNLIFISWLIWWPYKLWPRFCNGFWKWRWLCFIDLTRFRCARASSRWRKQGLLGRGSYWRPGSRDMVCLSWRVLNNKKRSYTFFTEIVTPFNVDWITWYGCGAMLAA
jgi:hypothetical protein